jgi:replicative DNA helicase
VTVTLEQGTPTESGWGRGFHTLSDQVGSLREFSMNPQQRIRTGIRSLDIITEGPAAGEIFTVMGRSFSGKSQVAVNVLTRNPDLPLILFSLEMPARQALQRLYCNLENMDHLTVVQQTKTGTLPSLLDELPKKLPWHVIVDKPGLTMGDMAAYVTQYDAYYGRRPVAVIIDYLELIQGEVGEGHFRTEMVAKRLKDWAKEENLAVFLLHQTNRTEPQWEPPTADSARGAGFTESDAVVGMWAPGTNPKLGETERLGLKNTIMMNVLKNRITGRTSDGRDIELKLEPSLRLVDLSEDQTKRFYS